MKLSPCPFCGGDDSDENACQEPKIFVRMFKSAIGVPAYRVECRCGVRGRSELDWQDAEHAWNTRVVINQQIGKTT